MSQLDILRQDQTSISTLNAGTGSRENGITVFEFAIVSILDFYGVNWKPTQIRDAAEMMHSDCYFFSVAELKNFVLRVKKADFGKITEDYSKFAPKHLMQCTAVYIDEVISARGQFGFMSKQKETEFDENAEYVDSQKVYDAIIKIGEEWDKNYGSKTEELDEDEIKRLEELKAERVRWIEEQGDNLNWAEFQRQFGKQKPAA